MRYLSFLFFVFLNAASIELARAEPETRAVLVGVGDYLTLDADLKGPPNDVRIMVDMLLRRGVNAANIRALTDIGTDLPNGIQAVAPDRRVILSEFTQAIEASGEGDTVLFYFSGHGTQAPDQNGDEHGGFDELFLPRDAGSWNGAIGEVENSIRDDELALLVSKAAQKAVKLVGIIDACHSATGFRAVSDTSGRARYIEPMSLGIPETTSSSLANYEPADGDYVFLYAAQSDQRAFEYPLGGEAWYGDFTRSLVNVLQEVPDLTYEQLAEAITLRLQTRSGQVAQTPDIEGPMATAGVFGASAGSLRRVLVEGTTLKAGVLQDVTVGSEIALYADPIASDPVGRARVSSLRATEAELEFLEPLPPVKVTRGAVVWRAPATEFSVSLTPDAQAVLNQLVPDGPAKLAEAVDFPLTENGTNSIAWTGSQFALLGRDGVLDASGPETSPRLLNPQESADPITDLAVSLSSHAQRVRLMQALAQLSGSSPSAFSLLTTSPDTIVRMLQGVHRGGRCRLAGSAKSLGNEARASHCDGLEVTISNASSKMQDVTVLYLDSEARISVLWPERNLSNRIPSGETRTLRFGLRNETKHPVRETLLVLSVSAKPGAPRTVLDGLAGGQTRASGGAMASYLAALADPDSASRSLPLTPPDSELNMYRLELTISPLN